MSHELDNESTTDPEVSWPDPSPLQSWWDRVMHGDLAPPKTRRGGQRAARRTDS
ncbi:hypothetical protein ACWEVD_22670 [Nocardia thailandica]|uniref:Uncharacterized protein n=1 Tax=Nocardia thailandica TaxID=257275 RepID=A0ABW6PTT2_9NOCA|nr:hypothetical protein [Nocardia thailandica]